MKLDEYDLIINFEDKIRHMRFFTDFEIVAVIGSEYAQKLGGVSINISKSSNQWQIFTSVGGGPFHMYETFLQRYLQIAGKKIPEDPSKKAYIVCHPWQVEPLTHLIGKKYKKATET